MGLYIYKGKLQKKEYVPHGSLQNPVSNNVINVLKLLANRLLLRRLNVGSNIGSAKASKP